MRITVAIDDEDMREVMKLTGKSSKSAAIAEAVAKYLRIRKVEHIQQLVREGKVNYRTTNDEIEAMWDDPR